MRRGNWLAAAAAAAMAIPQPVEAFGLRTHLYIGQQVLDDLEDCHLTLPGVEAPVKIDEPFCSQITTNPGAFLAGTIGPDAFPDPIVGQSFVHPGKPQGRQTADWLALMLEKAEAPDEIAFAYGNMLHAAGDIFAHSYVNNYSGDEFAIFARWQKDVELRHSLIERYIDQRIETVPETRLVVPADLIIRTMVQTSYVSGRIEIDEGMIRDFYENPTVAAVKLALTKLSSAKEATHMAVMRALLSISERERVGGPCREAEALRPMIDSYKAYLTAEHKARSNTGVKVDPLVFPDRVEKPSCKLGVGGHGLERQNPVFEAASAKVERMRAELAAVEKAAAMEADDKVASRRKRWLKSEAMKPYRRDLDRAYLAYEDEVRKYDRARALRVFTDLWAGEVRAAIAAYMEASRLTAEAMILNNGPHPPPLHLRRSSMANYTNWFACYRGSFRGLDARAADLHCDQLDRMGGGLGLSRASRRAAMGQLPRTMIYALADFQHELGEFMSDAMLGLVRMVNPGIRGLLDMLNEPERLYRDDLDSFFRKGRNGQLEFACASRWIDADIGIAPQTLDQARDGVYLDKDLGWVDDRDGGSKWKGRRGDCAEPAPPRQWVDPQKFIPIRHAITMSKLSLLTEAQVRKIATDAGESVRLVPAEGGRYSILLDAVRSLDGSYQWQGRAMPYPRREAKGFKSLEAGYPYPGAGLSVRLDFSKLRDARGFPYYQSQALREKVFARLFKEPFEGEILRRPEFNGGAYPFRPCRGDPFRRAGLGFGGEPFQEICRTAVD